MQSAESQSPNTMMQHEKLTTEEVWAEVSAAADELYQNHLEFNELDMFTLLPDSPEPVDRKRNWDVPAGLDRPHRRAFRRRGVHERCLVLPQWFPRGSIRRPDSV